MLKNCFGFSSPMGYIKVFLAKFFESNEFISLMRLNEIFVKKSFMYQRKTPVLLDFNMIIEMRQIQRL